MSFKKKLIAGILSGAVFVTGGLALADVHAAKFNRPPVDDRQDFPRHERRTLNEEQIADISQRIAEEYDVNQAEVAAALSERVSFGDVKHAATLAKISGKSFAEVLSMKCDWWQVAEKLGVTNEKFEAFMKDEMLTDLANESKLDKKTVESLLDDNYEPHDICMAGIIADASGKNVKSVLSKRKINNSWDDIAKDFNVDLKTLMEKERGNRR